MHKTPRDIIAKKAAGKKISVITAYDYSLATLCDKAGVDILLVGDSAGMVVLGYENTIPVTMTNMVIFTEAVSRAREQALVVGDLPFMSYQANISDAIKNSGKLIKAGADSVKLAKVTGAKIEINLFYANQKRKKNIVKALRKAGAREVLGTNSKSARRISGLDSARRVVDYNGIYKADVVVVPLEDGDRTIALKKAGKKVITIDLNPLPRTAKTADITIVDNVVRAINKLILECKSKKIRKTPFNNKKNLSACVLEIKKNLSRRMLHA